MNYKKQLYQNGVISTVNEIKPKRKPKRSQDHSQENIDICLNCTKSKCIGICELVRRRK